MPLLTAFALHRYVANAFLAGFQIAVDEEANRGYDSITLASAINMLQTAARAKAPLVRQPLVECDCCVYVPVSLVCLLSWVVWLHWLMGLVSFECGRFTPHDLCRAWVANMIGVARGSWMAKQAMLAMGYRYQFGLGVPESCRHAARYLVRPCTAPQVYPCSPLLGCCPPPSCHWPQRQQP